MVSDINALIQAVEEAGAEILVIQKAGFAIDRKANSDIVTKADLAANDILKARLSARFPGDGWLSEETVDDANRLSSQRVWIVDPIDGTIEFATGIPEYAISVALVEKGVPKMAVVFNPATGELFHACQGQGAFLNNKKIQCQQVASEKPLLLASRSEYKRGEWDKYQDCYDVKQVGSIAYKLALVAAGQAHATFSLGPKNEWDIAAGVLLVTEAGGIATDKEGTTFVFNQPTVLVNGIVAAASMMEDEIYAVLVSG